MKGRGKHIETLLHDFVFAYPESDHIDLMVIIRKCIDDIKLTDYILLGRFIAERERLKDAQKNQLFYHYENNN